MKLSRISARVALQLLRIAFEFPQHVLPRLRVAGPGVHGFSQNRRAVAVAARMGAAGVEVYRQFAVFAGFAARFVDDGMVTFP